VNIVSKRKGGERLRRVQNKLTPVERIAQRNIENEHRTRFNQAWFATVIRVTSECFHNILE